MSRILETIEDSLISYKDNFVDLEGARDSIMFEVTKIIDDVKENEDKINSPPNINSTNKNRGSVISKDITGSGDTIQDNSAPKKGGLKIIGVKAVGLCSKCRKDGDEILKYKDGRIIPDEDISCLTNAFGKCISPDKSKIGCGKVITSNTDYDGKMVVCGKYGNVLCVECQSKIELHKDYAKSQKQEGEK